MEQVEGGSGRGREIGRGAIGRYAIGKCTASRCAIGEHADRRERGRGIIRWRWRGWGFGREVCIS
jgi:hypothetical protein